MPKEKLPPDYLLKAEDGGFLFLCWNTTESRYEEPADSCWSLEREMVINASWEHYYEKLAEDWNREHYDDEKIFGYRFDDQCYHPECMSGPLPRQHETLTPWSEDIEQCFCAKCHESILDEDTFAEYVGCQDDGCECDICLEIAKLATETPEKSFRYLEGYRRGLLNVLADKVPAMTLERYARMVIGDGIIADFCEGYQDAERNAE